MTGDLQIKYCIFDMDGLLLNTEHIYSLVTTEILSRYGRQYSWTLKSKLMGLRQQEAAELMIRELELEGVLTPEDYLMERNAKHAELFPTAKPLAGVEKLIRHLKANGIPIAVATSSHLDAFKLKTSSAENQHLFSLFDTIVTGCDPEVLQGKPQPDIFLVAARRLGVTSDDDYKHCLVFEDAPNGVLAGLRAKMNVVWVPDGQLDHSEYKQCVDGVCAILKSLEDLDLQRFGLPQYG
ncbi:hypothetical protein MIR68_011004 [Amoeboaphelidium protococcarum]|nr:hypothetical protein MIR68_011004 [Amoeboaphelidium protococcarum]